MLIHFAIWVEVKGCWFRMLKTGDKRFHCSYLCISRAYPSSIEVSTIPAAATLPPRSAISRIAARFTQS